MGTERAPQGAEKDECVNALRRDLAAARADAERLRGDLAAMTCWRDCSCETRKQEARAERAEADAAALRAAIEQAPHGPECSAWTTLMGLVGKSLPCDCWKARALAAAPAPKEGTDA